MTPPTQASTEKSPESREGAASKRIRLSLACNQCRKRKVRCDTETPKCRNCWLRDEVCETTDPRYPENGPSVRRWATKDGLLPGQNPAATHRNQAQIPKHSSASFSFAETVASDQDRGDADRAHGKDTLPRRWSTSVSVSAATESTTQLRDAISASPAGTTVSPGSSAGAGAMSWVSRGYQTSISAGGGGEASAHDNDPSLVVNAESASSHRVKYMGGSSVQCLAAFVNIYLRRKGLQTISSHFRNGIRHVEEFQLPLTIIIPSLPDEKSLESYFDSFFSGVWPIYPVVDRPTVGADVFYFRQLELASGGLQTNLTPSYIPQLVTIFSIITIAADESAGKPTELGNIYLVAAYSLLAHLVATPYLTSVQALILLAVALRCRCKDGQAWHVVAQAIRVAHSIGLHRYIRPQTRQAVPPEAPSTGCQTDWELRARVWWSCYALEKLMELETGRPSAINDEDIDQMPPSSSVLMIDDAPDFFAHWVGLARIIGQISKYLYGHKPNSAWQLMHETGRLDRLLLEWSKALPDSIKPGHDLFAGYGLGQQPSQQNISSFLSLQYYQAQITLLRASLVFPSVSFIEEVKRLGPKLPSYARLLQSENICTGAARSTVRHVLELADHGFHSLITSATQLFLATIVLALHIVKNPNKRLVRSDLELLITATEHLEQYFSRGGQHPSFVSGFETLRTSIIAAANMEQRIGPAKLTPTADPGSVPDFTEGHRDFMTFLGEQSAVLPGITPDTTTFGLGDDIPLEELWGAIGQYSFLDPMLDDPPFQPDV